MFTYCLITQVSCKLFSFLEQQPQLRRVDSLEARQHRLQEVFLVLRHQLHRADSLDLQHRLHQVVSLDHLLLPPLAVSLERLLLQQHLGHNQQLMPKIPTRQLIMHINLPRPSKKRLVSKRQFLTSNPNIPPQHQGLPLHPIHNAHLRLFYMMHSPVINAMLWLRILLLEEATAC
jgi:hypothetical protein